MERSAIRDGRNAATAVPDFAALHPGYGIARLLRRQPHHLPAAVHFLEAVDEVFRALPAIGDLKAHELGDIADEAGAVGCLGVPYRRVGLQLLDIGEDA